MFGDTPLVMVETPEALAAAAAQLAEGRVIGVDTESDSFHHYQEKVCLLQISDLRTDFIVDPLAVGDLSPLGPIFADPTTVKIFHGADYDVVSLKRDYGFTFRNLFDTMVAAQFAGLSRIGLADLIREWWGHEIDKRYQRHDWAARPLLPEHLEYARGDTHFLPALREILLRRLHRRDRLRPVEEECRLLEDREWAGRRTDPSDFLRVKGSRALDPVALRVLRALYWWRDGEAKALDRPTFKVIPDSVLLDLAEARPETPEAVAARMRRGSPLARRFGHGLAAAVVRGLADETPLPTPPRPPPQERVPAALAARAQERLLQRLKDWRNQVLDEGGQSPVTVVSNGVLREVARRAPTTVDELATIPDVREWQVQQWGPALVAEVAIVLAEEDGGDEGRAARRKRRRRRGPPSGATSDA